MKVVPIKNARARGVVGWIDDAGNLSTFVGYAHGGDNQVDLACLQLRDAV